MRDPEHVRIVDDYLERVFKDARRVAPRVTTSPGDPTLQVVFGRAFLLELHLGDVELARVFARALLQTGRSGTSASERP